MKKLLMALCLLLVPAIAPAAEKACGGYYAATFLSGASGGAVSGTMAFACNGFSQGVIGIEYTSGAIGTGAYVRTSSATMSGTFDFYDAGGSYYTFAFQGLSMGLSVLGWGTVTRITSGDVWPGTFIGRRLWSMN